jgi:hypothetical protein
LDTTPGKDSRQIVTLANVGLLELRRCEAQTIRVIFEILMAGALLTDQRYIYDAMSYSLCCNVPLLQLQRWGKRIAHVQVERLEESSPTFCCIGIAQFRSYGGPVNCKMTICGAETLGPSECDCDSNDAISFDAVHVYG